MSSSSSSSFSEPQVRRCFCGIIADRITSWTDTNPGRRYLQCVNQGKRGGCNLWDWYDPVMCRRSVQVIPGLLRMNAKDARIRELEMENARLKDMEELMTDLVEARMTDLVEANDKMKKLEAQIKALTEENAKMKVMEANLEGFLEDNDKLQKLKKMLAIIAVIWYIWSVNRK